MSKREGGWNVNLTVSAPRLPSKSQISTFALGQLHGCFSAEA